jgi:hypothetical protein
LLIVTACDAGYYRSLVQLLRSLERCDGGTHPVRVYDLGMTRAQCETVQRRLRVEYRRFPFESVPSFVGADLRTYAWKPWIIDSVLEEISGPVLWLDSATLVLRPLDRIEQVVQGHGLWVPYGGIASNAERTHPATAAYLHASRAVLAERMRAAGVCGFDGAQPEVRRLVRRWRDCCLDPACVAPSGATHDNHRFDQSVLSILLGCAAHDGRFALTDDALDISSTRPTPYISARNKVHAWVPPAADAHLWRFFVLRRAANIASNRVEAQLRSVARPIT